MRCGYGYAGGDCADRPQVHDEMRCDEMRYGRVRQMETVRTDHWVHLELLALCDHVCMYMRCCGCPCYIVPSEHAVMCMGLKHVW